MRYAKSFNQCVIEYHATGKAMIAAIVTSFRKSFASNVTIELTFAPNTLRTPISFMRCVISNADSPNKPRQAMNIAMHANMVKMVPWRCSDS